MVSGLQTFELGGKSSLELLTWLRFALLPLVVLGMGNIIFELVAFDLNQLLKDMIGLATTLKIPINDFNEAHARIIWGTALFIFYAALICGSLLCIVILRKALSWRRQVGFVIIGSLIVILVFAHLLYSAHVRNNFSHIFFFTYDVLVASDRYSPFQITVIKNLVFTLNGLAGLVPIMTLLAGCCVLSHDKVEGSTPLRKLAIRMRWFKMIINSGSFLLVTGILHMMAWLRWSAVLAGDNEVGSTVVAFTEAVVVYWGVVFSLLLVSFYVPAALSISRRAEVFLNTDTEQNRGIETKEWLEKNGLSTAPMQQLPQVVAVLAPLLAGPLGATFSSVVGAYPA